MKVLLAVLWIISLSSCSMFDGWLSWMKLSRGIGESAPNNEISDGDIATVLGQKKYLLIYFYSTSCGHCTKFNPDFNYLSQIYANNDGLQILQTNAKVNRRLSQLFSVTHYPSLKLVNFETKEISTYSGERSIDNLNQFILVHTGSQPNYDNISSDVIRLNDFNYLQTLTKDTAVVFLTSNTEGWENPHYPQHFYQKFPVQFDWMQFAIVNIDDAETGSIQRQFRVSNAPSMILSKSDGLIKTFKTLSLNPRADLVLTLDQCEQFIKDPKFGTWYENIDALQKEFINNNNDNDVLIQALEQEYEDLLDEMYF